jgi:hypothetical protein
MIYWSIRQIDFGGGAIYLKNNSTLSCYNCTFVSNGFKYPYRGGLGGAISVHSNSAILCCVNCLFVNNFALKGGAVSLM